VSSFLFNIGSLQETYFRQGWFILLTSLLGFYRVKRWERGILASRRDNAPAPTTQANPIISHFESSFSLRGMSRADLFRQGFGFGATRNREDDEATREAVRAEEGESNGHEHSMETDPMIPLHPSDPERSRAIIQAFANEQRLQRDLREAGLL
jgi:hypothetical protein